MAISAYISAKGTRYCCIIMDPELVATHLVALLTYMFIRFDVRVMGEQAESVKAACDSVCKSRTHNN